MAWNWHGDYDWGSLWQKTETTTSMALIGVLRLVGLSIGWKQTCNGCTSVRDRKSWTVSRIMHHTVESFHLFDLIWNRTILCTLRYQSCHTDITIEIRYKMRKSNIGVYNYWYAVLIILILETLITATTLTHI